MRRIALLAALCLLLVPRSFAQATWAFVQDTVITTCVANSSSCAINVNIAPTTAGTVWVVRIHTPNNVTISSVSGGGATWNLCPTSSCHLFNSGFNDNQDLAYAFNGTAGTTAITVNLSGSAGSFFGGNFIEILPPAGSTASFDTATTSTSSTCTTCTAPTLTLSATDAVLQIFSGNGVAAWNSWSSPYFTDMTGNGIGLNITSGTGPTATAKGAGGGDITAIAFKSTFGTFTPPSQPISVVNYANPRGVNCNPSCSLTVPATSTAHLLYLEAANLGGGFISSVSGGGAWVVPTGANSCRISMSGAALSCAYVLTSASGTTSLNVTLTGTASTSFAYMEVATTSGQFLFDAQGSATNAAQLFPRGVTLTLNGSSPDVVFQSAFIPGGASNASFYPQPLDGFNFIFTNGTFGVLANVTGATAPVPVYDDLQNNQTIVTGVAFKAATTINSADCTSASVQSALNLVAADGMTVAVPSCPAGVTWASQVTYNQVFSTTLQGQTTCTGTGTQTPTCTDNTVISGAENFLTVNTASGKSMRITGFTLQLSGSSFNGMLHITGPTTQLRMDNNHLLHMQAVAVVDGPLGVIDHNFFDFSTSQSVFNGVRVGNGAWNGFQFGDGSWADTSQFGSSKFLFFEDNTAFNGFINDCNDGGRFVMRHNYFHDATMQGHEMESRMQGCRAYESYSNTFFAEAGQQSGADTSNSMLFRTGTGLLWGNTSNYNNLVTINNDRSDTSHGFSAANSSCPSTGGPGFNCWGYACNNAFAVGTVCDGSHSLPSSPSAFDGNTDAFGYPATQQVGRGKGDLFPQFDFTSASFWSAGEPKFHNNQLEPLYLWLNTFTPPFGGPYLGSAIGASLFQQNRDWYTDNAGSQGVRTGTSLPATCTPLQAFWNTTTSTLSQCTSTNTWTTFYQPFTYPHPLAQQSGGTPAVQLIPTSVSFVLPQAIGTTSAAQGITLSNVGSATLNITSISVSGANATDFVIAVTGTTCPTSGGTLGAGLSCNVNVTFAPTITSSESASMVFTTNASTSPDAVALSGTGAIVGKIQGSGSISGTGVIHN